MRESKNIQLPISFQLEENSFSLFAASQESLQPDGPTASRTIAHEEVARHFTASKAASNRFGAEESIDGAEAIREQAHHTSRRQKLWAPSDTENKSESAADCSIRPERRQEASALTLDTIQDLEERLSLSAAAAALGVSPAELRRACRRLGVQRWRHRAHAATAAAVAAPEERAVAYTANLRRKYSGGSGASAREPSLPSFTASQCPGETQGTSVQRAASTTANVDPDQHGLKTDVSSQQPSAIAELTSVDAADGGAP